MQLSCCRSGWDRGVSLGGMAGRSAQRFRQCILPGSIVRRETHRTPGFQNCPYVKKQRSG